jgi:hypothetical protein
MANGGLNAVQTYIAWNVHEPVKGQYVWTGGADIEAFLQLCQKYNLYAILRAGPYICGEWDLGGFPWWLLTAGVGLNFRTSDPIFMGHVSDFYTVLYKKLRPYMYVNGGVILSVQIENEYGGYWACDHEYLHQLCQLARDGLGEETVLFTVDSAYDVYATCGTIPEEAYATVDFGSQLDAQASFDMERRWNGGSGPYVNSEFYTGGTNRWGASSASPGGDGVANRLDELLALGGSVSAYMYYGGSNLGYHTGGLGDEGAWYDTVAETYDHGAPLPEEGDMTYTYQKMLEVIKKYRDVPVYDVVNLTKRSYGTVKFVQGAALLDVLDAVSPERVEHEEPLEFETMGWPDGYCLYQAVAGRDGLLMGDVSDRAVVMRGRQIVTTATRPVDYETVVLAGDQLNILVENLGRVNFAWTMGRDLKGLGKDVSIQGEPVRGWVMRPLPLAAFDSSNVTFSDTLPVNEPAFYRGTFKVDTVADTFFNPGGLNRGAVFINGVSIGRYWTVGSQLTLYVRSKYLREGENEVVVFESGVQSLSDVSFDDHPNLHIPPSPLNGKRNRPPIRQI